MKIPFDISKKPQIESGEYKVEFGGKPARIICWDKKRSKDNATIIALIDDGESEHTEYFFSDGIALCITAPALHIVTPEPEMSEMEISLLSWLSDDTSGRVPMKEMKRVVKARAAELLDLAKQQLLQSGELLTQEHHEKLMETLREECKKDLPRWRTGSIEGDRIVGLSLYHDSKWIPFFDLEKLPGFNDEDHE